MANDKQNKQRRFYLDGYAQHPEWYTWHYEMLKKLKDIDNNTSGDINVSFDGAASDAFGRLRVSSPLTLFDSSHRYADNDLFNEDITGTASSTFNADQGLVDLDVGTASGDKIIRESNKVFAYQPGKSLLIMNTFVMDTAKTNLRQRVGYFGSENGFYIEQDDTTVNLVKRSKITGSVVNTEIAQSSWNGDKLDGTGASGYTLDLTKSQILWMDMEWLGVGNVRIGFIINGTFIVCHTFQCANILDSTYITTASLPIRYEITNTGTVASTSQLKQICSTVISEGGYELRGRQQAIGTVITSPYTLTTAGTYYPLASIRLKAARLDAIAILTALSILGTGNGIFYNWQLVAGGSITGGTWVSAGANSSVEYNITGTAHTIGTGRILASGFIASNNQSSASVDILKEALFKFQLERNTFTSTPEVLTIRISSDTDTQDAFASMDWEEITR
jgi:hypothetical protein